MSEKNLDLSKELKNDKIGIGLGAFGYNFGAAGLVTYLTFFYTDYMLIPAASVALILLVSRFINALSDLLMGMLIDRTTSKMGKVRPWLLWMALPAIICIMATYFVPNLSTSGRTIYAFVTYNLMAFFYLTAMALPMQALASVITTNTGERLKLSQIFGFTNTLAGVVINLFAAKMMALFGGGANGFFYYFGVIAIIGGLLMVACFMLTKERADKKILEKVPFGAGSKALSKNKYFWILAFMGIMVSFVPAMWAVIAYYCKYILANQVAPGALMSLMFGGMTIGVLVFIPITKKIGKIPSSALGFSLQILGSVILIFAPTSVAVIWISTLFRSLGTGAYASLVNAIRADIVDYGEWKSGIRTEGMIFSGSSFGVKIGTAIGGAVVPALLAWGKYIPGAVTQAASAIAAIKFAFIYCPLIGTTIVVICLLFMNSLEKRLPQIKADLADRRAKEIG